jgi:kynureninase
VIDRPYCRSLDAADPLAAIRGRFAQAAEDTVYLDGNSIGAMPADLPSRMQAFLLEGWRDSRRRGWSRFDWLEQPWLLGDALAPLIGAPPQSVLFADNTTVNLFKLLAYAWRLQAHRPVILIESHMFPTDAYVAQGLAHLTDHRAIVRFVESPAALGAALTGDVGVVFLSLVDYRSSVRWDMAQVNQQARAAGALTLWDLSHAAGALGIALAETGADFAVGCGYKYLCGGPGAPAWLYVHPQHQNRAWPAICGWMGHEDVFRFEPEYAPAPGVRRHLTGTTAVMANVALMAAADIWRSVDPASMARKHQSLSELLVALLDERCSEYGLRINSPRNYSARGAHLTFSHPGAGRIVQALLERGVVSSFRKPDAIRFGLSPLALSHEDIWLAVDRLSGVLRSELWREPRFEVESV